MEVYQPACKQATCGFLSFRLSVMRPAKPNTAALTLRAVAKWYPRKESNFHYSLRKTVSFPPLGDWGIMRGHIKSIIIQSMCLAQSAFRVKWKLSLMGEVYQPACKQTTAGLSIPAKRHEAREGSLTYSYSLYVSLAPSTNNG